MQNAVNFLELIDKDGYTIQDASELTIEEAKKLGDQWLAEYSDAVKYEIWNKTGLDILFDKFK